MFEVEPASKTRETTAVDLRAPWGEGVMSEYIRAVSKVYAEALKHTMTMHVAAVAVKIAHKQTTGRRLPFAKLVLAMGYRPTRSLFDDIRRIEKNPETRRAAHNIARHIYSFAKNNLQHVFISPRFANDAMYAMYTRVLQLAGLDDAEVCSDRRSVPVVAARTAFSVLARVSPTRYSYPEIARALHYGGDYLNPCHNGPLSAHARYWDESRKIVGRELARSIVHALVAEYGWKKEYDNARVLQISKQQTAQQDRSLLVELRV